MLTVYPDSQITRRKSHHYVLDEHDKMVWTGPKLNDLLVWLYENGHYAFVVQGAESTWKVTIDRVPF